MGIEQLASGINWLAVGVATVSAFALGGIWYSNALFGKRWMQEVGLTDDALANTKMKPIYTGTFVLQLVAATALARFLGADSSLPIGLHAGLLIGLCWIAPAYGVTYLFEQRSLWIFFINAGYYVVMFAAMGAIIGAWQ